MSDRKPEDEPSTSQGKGRKINEEARQPNVKDEKATNQFAIGEMHAVNLQFKNEIVAAIKESHAKSITEMEKVENNIKAELQKVVDENIKANSELQKEMRELSKKMTKLEAKIAKYEMPPKIFKLDVDCVQEVFDYLSVEDIHSVSKTCTRMHRIARDYFETNLKSLELVYSKGEFKIPRNNLILNEFKEFVQKLQIDESSVDNPYSLSHERFRSIGLRCKSLKQIKFIGTMLNTFNIQYLKPILSKIETIFFHNRSYCEGDFYEEFLKFCPKLKNLCLGRYQGSNNEWLLRSYPTLEHLELIYNTGRINELATFFERNPNLQMLSIRGETFLQNIDVILQSKMKLQVLSLLINRSKDRETICRHLEQLYNQGFYQRLYWYGDSNPQITSSLNLLGLKTLYLHSQNELDLSSLANLNEMRVFDVNLDLELVKVTAKNLVNVERLWFKSIKPEMLEAFIRYSTKLNAIKIDWLHEAESIDLPLLNKEREKLAKARKVTIYLNETAYLDVKWNNKATDFKMLEVKRAESHEWQSLSFE